VDRTSITQDGSGLRQIAHDFGVDGLASFAKAFNFLDEDQIPFRRPQWVKQRFRELAIELVELVEHAPIEPNLHHEHHLQMLAARNDIAVQALIRRASKKTPMR